MVSSILRAVYNITFQRRLYYHLLSKDKPLYNFRIKHGLFFGLSPKLSFKEICSRFAYALYVGESDPSAMVQVDKWFSCHFFRKKEVLILLYGGSTYPRKKIIQFFMEKKYNFVYLPDFSQLALHPIRAVFYVFNSLTNPYIVNLREAKHIHIGHGESDKEASVNIMFRIYDHILASGEIALGRLEKAGIVSAPDVTQDKVVRIGMPFVQASHQAIKEREGFTDDVSQPLSILYAPTWEGATARQRYSSLRQNVGFQYLSGLIKHGMVSTMAFRPHPSTGIGAPQYIERCLDIITLLSEAYATEARVLGEGRSYIFNAFCKLQQQQRLPSCQLVEQPLELETYDLVVTDISSIISACLAYGVPFVVLHMRQGEVNEGVGELYEKFPLCRGGINYIEDYGYFETIRPGHDNLQDMASRNLHAMRQFVISYDAGLDGCATNRELFERVCTKLSLYPEPG